MKKQSVRNAAMASNLRSRACAKCPKKDALDKCVCAICSKAFREGFRKGAAWKEDKLKGYGLPGVMGYVARDKDADYPVWYSDKPRRTKDWPGWTVSHPLDRYVNLPKGSFQDLKWEDEPIFVLAKFEQV